MSEGDVETCCCDEVGWVEETEVCSVGVVEEEPVMKVK